MNREIQAAETGSQEHLNGSGHDMKRALAIGFEVGQLKRREREEGSGRVKFSSPKLTVRNQLGRGGTFTGFARGKRVDSTILSRG